MRNIWCILYVAVLCALAFGLGRHSAGRERRLPVADTVRVTVVDTARVVLPVAVDSVVVRTRTVRLAVVDTVRTYVDVVCNDSVDVELPITQKHYADSLYEAWVSGYEAQLDSVRVYVPVTTTTITERVCSPARRGRWHIGVSAGVGVSAKGAGPYLGVGVTYSLFCL